MKRKAVALAVGALFAAPAAQAQLQLGNDKVGTLQVYGKFYPQIGTYQDSGAFSGPSSATLVGTVATPAGDNGNRVSVDSQNSYLGFRGERNLVGGWKGLVQLEQSVDLEFDGGGGTFSNRNTFGGLGHKTFGTIKLGNMDTIYKEYGDTMSLFGVSSGNFVSASNVLSHIGLGSNNLARFHERRPHSIQYQSGEFGGFQAGVQYAPDELKGNAGRTINQNTVSYGVKWDSEHFYVSVQHEIHNDLFGASANIPVAGFRNGTGSGSSFVPDASASAKDKATRLSGEFRFFGSQRIVADVARLEYKESSSLAGTRFQKYTKPTWAIGYDGGFGAWRVAMQYVNAGEGECDFNNGTACVTDGLGANLITAGVRWRFDRQTFLYLIAARLSLDDAALHDNWQNGTPNRGSDNTQFALGISYSF